MAAREVNNPPRSSEKIPRLNAPAAKENKAAVTESPPSPRASWLFRVVYRKMRP